MLQEETNGWRTTAIILMVLTFTMVAAWLVSPDTITTDYEKGREAIVKWWRRPTRRTNMQKRILSAPKRYYVPGTKHKSARVYDKKYKGYGTSESDLPSTVINYIDKTIQHAYSCVAQAGACMISCVEDCTWLGIDTLSTYCITNDLQDFTTTTIDVNEGVTGIGGKKSKSATITKEGSGVFKIVDDLGVTCKIPIPRLFYCKTAT
jgi:hypothetical protein